MKKWVVFNKVSSAGLVGLPPFNYKIIPWEKKWKDYFKVGGKITCWSQLRGFSSEFVNYTEKSTETSPQPIRVGTSNYWPNFFQVEIEGTFEVEE